MEPLPVVNEYDPKWMRNAPQKIKLDSYSEGYNYWPPLTKPVEDLDMINSATKKKGSNEEIENEAIASSNLRKMSFK